MDCSNRTPVRWIGSPAALVVFRAVPGFQVSARGWQERAGGERMVPDVSQQRERHSVEMTVASCR
jgi:hypothetical protein